MGPESPGSRSFRFLLNGKSAEVQEILEFIKSTMRGILPSLGQHAEENAEAGVSQSASH